jgi:6-pyruvoyltetrahydropterin/6-carboxytetrahydropterin synthase
MDRVIAPANHYFTSSKCYPASVGLSCTFRQWKAKHSHCRYLHGYSLEVKMTFASNQLDSHNWVVDFGGLKQIKEELVQLLDHKTLVAFDDPEFSKFEEMMGAGLIQMVGVPMTGCEGLAKLIFEKVDKWFENERKHPESRYYNNPAVLMQVQVSEHEGNSATYSRVVAS